MSDNRYTDLEQTIGYCFNDKSLLDIAFTHKSYSNEVLIKKFESYGIVSGKSVLLLPTFLFVLSVTIILSPSLFNVKNKV